MLEWSTACPDWEKRITSGQSLVPPPLYPEFADEAIEVMKALRIVDIAGSPTIGECSADWVLDFAKAIFGSYNPDTGVREIKEFFLLISKKNTKSTSAAAIMLTLMVLNWRESAEMIILAPTKEVAMNAYAPIRDMVKADEELDNLFQVQDHTKTITHRRTKATLKVLAAEQDTVGGKKASIVLIDEIHIFGKNPRAEPMLREAVGGLASRDEGCVIYLTTQSDEPPAGIFLKKLRYARDVRDGLIDDKRFLPVLYEFPKKMIQHNKHLDPKNFWMVNPNLGRSVNEEWLVREFEKAKIDGDDSVAGFLAKHLNVEIGLNLRSNRWAGADFWLKNSKKYINLDYILENSEVIGIGIDGGGLDDLLGLSVMGRSKEDPKIWFAWFHAWAHPSVLERRKEVAPRLRDFADAGQLTLVTRVGDDVKEVSDICQKCFMSDLLYKIGVDKAGISSILDELETREIPNDMIVAVPQGWQMSGSIKNIERKLAADELYHDGSELMAWCVGNAKIAISGQNTLVTKQVSGSAKIDPLMAGFNAGTLLGMNPEARTERFQMFVV